MLLFLFGLLFCLTRSFGGYIGFVCFFFPLFVYQVSILLMVLLNEFLLRLTYPEKGKVKCGI